MSRMWLSLPKYTQIIILLRVPTSCLTEFHGQNLSRLSLCLRQIFQLQQTSLKAISTTSPRGASRTDLSPSQCGLTLLGLNLLKVLAGNWRTACLGLVIFNFKMEEWLSICTSTESRHLFKRLYSKFWLDQYPLTLPAKTKWWSQEHKNSISVQDSFSNCSMFSLQCPELLPKCKGSFAAILPPRSL
jgi:hypothetical protein